MAGEIVVGYDGTEGANAAFDEALRLCRDLGAGLVAVFGYSPGLAEREVADHREALHELGEQHTRAAAERAEREGIAAEREVVPLRGAEALVRIAEDRNARMIVVGGYGERPIKGALLGSTPHKLLHLSEKPVLVVRV